MNILIADQHPVFRSGLKAVLRKKSNFHIVGKVENGNDLIASIEKYEPDILVLEIELPQAHGVGSLRTIRKAFPELKIMVLSSLPEEVYTLSCIKAGANGYLSKTRNAKEIKKAIIKVSQGETFIPKNIKDLIENKDRENDVLKFKKLSTRELEVLNLLASGNRNKEIALALSINEKTVSTYKTRLLKKLNVDNLADLIHKSRLMGFSF